MKTRNSIILLIASLCCLSACTTAPLPSDQRPQTWAQRQNEAGLPNFHCVSDCIYRGGQPTRQGYDRLQKMGVRTVINMRESNSDHGLFDDKTFNYIRIPMSAWSVGDDEVIAFLKIAINPANLPVFFHCHRGSDRAGVLCAMYRITIQGWTREEAIREMTCNDMGFHSLYQNLVAYVRNADVEKIKRESGIQSATAFRSDNRTFTAEHAESAE